MADMTVNEWFQNANAPMLDIANMLIALDIEGKLPEGMREAIKKHAENAADSLPGCIAALSSALASSFAGGVGLGSGEAAQAAWGVASIADAARGMNSLVGQFANAEAI